VNRVAAGRRNHAGGFTLIELLVAMAVLAIVLAVAIPNYRQWVLESGRAEAKTVLMQGAQTLERCFTRFSRYDDANCGLSAGDTVDSENDKYRLTVDAVGSTTFDLTAAPLGKQAEDTECGSFTLDETGTRGVSTGTDPAECW